jgi:DNA-binding NarL/FixJ family response regulator
LEQQIQELATQGLSVQQIALDLNLPASVVTLYITAGQPSSSS